MFWFKKPIKVKCYDTEELGKLLNWLRRDTGLSEMNRQRYPVTAVMAMQYWDDPNELMYFEVEVPYYQYKQLREKYIEREAFDPILEQRVFSEIMNRDL